MTDAFGKPLLNDFVQPDESSTQDEEDISSVHLVYIALG